MPLLQHLQRQVTRASTGRLSAHPYRAANHIWRPQQRAQFHRLFAQKTANTTNNTATWRQLLSRFRNPSSRRWNSSRPNPDPTPQLGSPTPQLSFFQRFRQLGKEYGWVVTGVYFGLSALDLPFCFLAVRALGTDRVARWEHAIVGTIKDAIKTVMPDVGAKADEVVEQVETAVGSPAAREGNVWGVPEAEARNKEEASLWTQFVLAYAIHKSFIFVRVPLAVAVTPKVVKILRSWGWQVGKKKLRDVKIRPTKP
ncbi:hypothetical protein E4T50_07272 [Aureobasidium sp. EXF-12298]|nr:hypothetical protein E4T50_07272 [Aureobasidium sp. EXF-12298]KAI4763848.1 hypothetical protein E4T51_03156 [Aureobasidium sp. EXF-12344]KAI4780895.1 hypothetical protein E4T52_04230 [Aureobasidium sp. EXF-3400]